VSQRRLDRSWNVGRRGHFKGEDIVLHDLLLQGRFARKLPEVLFGEAPG
jgi:hypothetical protein